ncbi:hypothetical protein IQ249_22325 [Lusitaniella coriacea LEGE 07157]|uniref:Uncharacterized protein n=1 Tax=Lusitaniella coriacea LEGE 07157 TaxID=945747 RepID=A0A8J7JE34_9CYAN|nr:hypothetical protein [Lusitaniella coriacea]MBE9118630.1 hypothetical protein [Lusitaniella coriacea LEGE 07157]
MQEEFIASKKQLESWDGLTNNLSLASLAICGVSAPIALYATAKNQPGGILAGYSLTGTGLFCLFGSLLIGRIVGDKLGRIRAELKLAEKRYHEGKTEGINQGKQETEREWEKDKQERDRVWESKLTDQLTQQKRDLEQSFQALTERLEALITQKEEQIAQLREAFVIARSEGESEASRRYERRLTDLNEDLELARNRVRRVEDLKRENEQLNFALQARQQALDSKEEMLRHREMQTAQSQSQVQQVVENNRQLQQLTTNLQREMEMREQEIAAMVESTRNQAVAETQEKLANMYQLELEKASAIAARLKAELSTYRRRENLDKGLPELRNLLVKGDRPILKPAFIVGDQGSGKALHSVELARLFSLGADSVIAIALDISEGGREDSSWARLGVPVTNDREAFFRLLKAVKAQLDNPQSSLPFRNDKQRYWASPPILLFIDEALTSFAGMTKDELVEISEAIRAIETRGSKRKVFLVAMGTNDQIQNLSPEGKGSKGGTQAVKIWNTGTLNSYLQIYLNDAAKALATDEELKANLGLQHYLAAYGDGYFIASAKWMDGKGKFLKPFKHVSHHGHLLTETIPSRAIEPVYLAPCPGFFPQEIKCLYQQFLRPGIVSDLGGDDEGGSHTLRGDNGGKGDAEGTRESLERLLSLNPSEQHGDKIENSAKGLEITSTCPHCGGKDFAKNGKNRAGKQRLKCKSCGKNFS